MNSQEELKSSGSTNHNNNKVNVNNTFNLTINLGDSLNIIALVAGILLLKRILKKERNDK
ncbi:hypothetical protein ACFYKX_19645 [Cytobacillus sp. FJAT-54145]|uniref:LPXTG cell wall anchor domain-containing protein n=1 Tax=Cytobacillus spartinae TaxID=3299023 RepID=A0ABW6KF75_9BACI